MFGAGRETFVVACIAGSINCYVSGCLYLLGPTADVAISFRSSIRYTKPRLNFLLKFKISRIKDVTLYMDCVIVSLHGGFYPGMSQPGPKHMLYRVHLIRPGKNGTCRKSSLVL